MGRRIKAARKHRALIQEDLARKLGVRANQVSRWECGREAPGRLRLLKLETVLGVPVAWLMTGAGGEAPPVP